LKKQAVIQFLLKPWVLHFVSKCDILDGKQ
jgi:hypothetical protein